MPNLTTSELVCNCKRVFAQICFGMTFLLYLVQFISLAFGIGFPSCPPNGILNCSTNDTDFNAPTNFSSVSDCVYIGCPSLIFSQSSCVIRNVTFRDSARYSILIADYSVLNVSDSQFYHSPISINGSSTVFSVTGSLFTRSSHFEATGTDLQLRFESSNFTNNQVSDFGGAMYIDFCERLSLTLSNCQFDGNQAGVTAGAIYVEGFQSILIVNCTFSNNYSLIKRGAIGMYNGADAQILGCRFIRNSAQFNTGAMYGLLVKRLVIRDSLFKANTAASIGALFLSQAGQGVVIGNCRFEGNYAIEGASSIQAQDFGSSALLIDSCSFSNNSAFPLGYSSSVTLYFVRNCVISNSSFLSESSFSFGGSTFLHASKVSLTGCAFIDCYTVRKGGAIYLEEYSTADISSSVFRNNAGETGGSIYTIDSTLNLSNCTITESKSTSDGGSVILISSKVNISGCRFRDSFARFHGGSILADSSHFTIWFSDFYNGNARTGGQIFTTNSSFSITGCHFDNNYAVIAGFIHISQLSSDGSIHSITRSIIENSNASVLGGAVVILNDNVAPLLIQDVVFNNTYSSHAGLMHIDGIDALAPKFINCSFVNTFCASLAIGSLISTVNFWDCLFISGISFRGTGTLLVYGERSTFTNCRFVNAQSFRGGVAKVVMPASVVFLNCSFVNISAFDGGIVSGTSGSEASLINCVFESIQADSLGVIAYTSGFISVIDCWIKDMDPESHSPLFYVSGEGSFLHISGLSIHGELPDTDGSLLLCRLHCTAVIEKLSLSSSQSILRSFISIDTFSSVSVRDSALIDLQGSSLIKASTFSNVTISNCSIMYTEALTSSTMDQMIYLENGCFLTINGSTTITNFQGKIAVLLAFGGSSFNCRDSIIEGTRVPESAVKLYDGEMTSNNCIFVDNVSTGSVSECISSSLGISIVAAGGAIFGYSSSIALSGETQFRGNEADLGGAIYCVNCVLTFDDVIMQENRASLSGGVAWADSSNVQIGNCQVSGNIALNLPASKDVFLSSGQLSRSMDSSNISIYIADDSLSSYILSNSDKISFAGLRGLARSFSILEYKDTISINSTSDFLPIITVVALDAFNEIVSIDSNDPIIIQVYLEGNNDSSSFSGERSKLMFTEGVIFSDLEIVGRVPGASYNVTISSSNRPQISPKSISVIFQGCDSEREVLIKGTKCVPLLAGNSGGVITIISIFWMIIFPFIGISLVYLNKFRHYDLIKVNSFAFLFVSGIGSLLAVSAPLFYFFDLGCIPSIFLERIGFTLVFAALSLKVYRIHTILNTTSRNDLLQNSRLTKILGILVLLVFTYLLAWVLLDPPKVTISYSSQLDAATKNSCPMDSPFAVVLEVAQFSAVLILSYLAFLTRGIPEKFNEARLIGFACYNWLLFGCFFYLMAEYFIASPDLKIIFKALSLYISHLIISVSLITLKVYRSYKIRLRMEEENRSAIETNINSSIPTSLFDVILLRSPIKSMLSPLSPAKA